MPNGTTLNHGQTNYTVHLIIIAFFFEFLVHYPRGKDELRVIKARRNASDYKILLRQTDREGCRIGGKRFFWNAGRNRLLSSTDYASTERDAFVCGRRHRRQAGKLRACRPQDVDEWRRHLLTHVAIDLDLASELSAGLW